MRPYRPYQRGWPYRRPMAQMPAAQMPGPAQEIRRVPTLTLEVPQQPATLEYSSDPKKRINPKLAQVMRY